MYVEIEAIQKLEGIIHWWLFQVLYNIFCRLKCTPWDFVGPVSAVVKMKE